MPTRFKTFSQLFAHVWLRTMVTIPVMFVVIALILGIVAAWTVAGTVTGVAAIIGGFAMFGLYIGFSIAVLCGWVFALIISYATWNSVKESKFENSALASTINSVVPLAMLCPGQSPPVEDNPYRYD